MLANAPSARAANWRSAEENPRMSAESSSRTPALMASVSGRMRARSDPLSSGAHVESSAMSGAATLLALHSVAVVITA